jgi:CheY-like chemotaxis protein
MNKQLKCIMLVDDNSDDNFFHERIISKNNSVEKIISMENAVDALSYITTKLDQHESCPDLIFLDINMPGMNGWDFLDEYKKLKLPLQKSVIIVMLTTSDNIEDQAKALALNVVSDFRTKPLTTLMLEDIIDKYFPPPTS